MRFATPTVAFLVAAASAASAASTVAQLPVACRGGETISSAIEPAGDADSFAVYLGAGDALTVNASESGPAAGLLATLAITDAVGNPIAAAVTGQGTSRVALAHTAAAAGTVVIRLTGDPGGFGGATGDYRLAIGVKRVKPAKQTFADAAGGAISVFVSAPEGSTLTVSASTKKGGFDLTEVRRPDGSAEPGFAAALKAKKRRNASIKKLALTGGGGAYEIRGAYDAGSTVKVKVKLATNEKKRSRRLTPDEPRFDPLLTPFPSVGIPGTVINVSGAFLDDVPILDRRGNEIGRRYPTFVLGGVEVPADDVAHPNGAIYTFPVPPGLAVGQWHDLALRNGDGQSSLRTEAFFVVPPPQATGFTLDEAGPAGGRRIRILGLDFRPGSSVMFDATLVQPTTIRSNYIDVVAPAHAPGAVQVTVRDEFGQTSVVPEPFTYLDIGSNRIASISPEALQGVGGQTIVVNGEDFVEDTVLTLDGVEMERTLVSPTRLEFLAPEHAGGTVELRVTDQYEQTSVLDVTIGAFTNETSARLPAPVTTANQEDGFRATRILRGDVSGDGRDDLILLRPEQAFGDDQDRSRIRVLFGTATGTFTDQTASKLPAVTDDDDWRARDGVLADLDGDDSLDLAIVTDESLAGGTRSSLRILLNDGSGGFSDATAASAPAITGYGDRNQAVAIAAEDFDGANGTDLVIVSDEAGPFVETIVIPGGEPTPPDPPPPDVIIENYFPRTRLLLNDGSGVFSRADDALPAVDPDDAHQFQAACVAAGDVTGDGRADVLLTSPQPLEDAANEGTFLLTMILLENGDTGAAFTDASAVLLPAASDPEYLQGDRVQLADLDGDDDLDLLVVLTTRVVSPESQTVADSPSLRLFENDGSGSFTAWAADALPGADGEDFLQARGVAVGDVTGDGAPEIVLVSTSPPNFGERGGRILVKVGDAWLRGSEGLLDPFVDDDLRGADVILLDADGDQALDILVGRDEPDESVPNTILAVNPR